MYKGFSVFSGALLMISKGTLLRIRNRSQRRYVPEFSCLEHPSEQQKNLIPHAVACLGSCGYLRCIHHLGWFLDRLLATAATTKARSSVREGRAGLSEKRSLGYFEFA